MIHTREFGKSYAATFIAGRVVIEKHGATPEEAIEELREVMQYLFEELAIDLEELNETN